MATQPPEDFLRRSERWFSAYNAFIAERVECMKAIAEYVRKRPAK